MTYHCHCCGKLIEFGGYKYIRSRAVTCSPRCNNQLLRAFDYQRDKDGKINRWNFRHHFGLADDDHSKDYSRLWIYIGDLCFHWEMVFWKWDLALCLDMAEIYEDDITFHFAVPGISFWTSLELPWKYRLDVDKTIINLYLYQGDFVWQFMFSESIIGQLGHVGINGRFNLMDWIFGSFKYESVVLSEQQILLKLPEASYHCKVSLTKDIWTRPRSWMLLGLGQKTLRHVTIDCNHKSGIPVGGKHETICSSTFCADSIDSGIKNFTKKLLSERIDNGWTPTPPSSVVSATPILSLEHI